MRPGGGGGGVHAGRQRRRWKCEGIILILLASFFCLFFIVFFILLFSLLVFLEAFEEVYISAVYAEFDISVALHQRRLTSSLYSI